MVDSPWGPLTLECNNRAIVSLKFGKTKLPLKSHPLLKKGERQLKEYFAGKRDKFSLPLETTGTEFQKKVWQALKKVPFGKVKSYQALGQDIGREKASRAVGNALGKNHIPIILPCHRIVAKGRKIGGFTGGLATKRFLLKHEGVNIA